MSIESFESESKCINSIKQDFCAKIVELNSTFESKIENLSKIIEHNHKSLIESEKIKGGQRQQQCFN